VHEYSAFNGKGARSLDTTIRMSERVLSLPIYPSMKDEDISYVSQTIRSYLREA